MIGFQRLLIWGWVGCWFLTACGTSSPATPQLRPQPTCVSSTPGANPYLEHSQAGAVRVYEHYLYGRVSYEGARQIALARLGENLQHWSDHVDLVLDDSRMVRITVTYLDPALVQYVVLNQTLAYANATDLNTFNALLIETQRKLGERQETLFLMTLTTPASHAAVNGDYSLQLPVWQMGLVTDSGLQALPAHVDPGLNQKIDLSRLPLSGLIGYPLAITGSDGQCKLVMDSWTTQLTLNVASLLLNKRSNDGLFWRIPFRALILQDDPQAIPTYDPLSDPTRQRTNQLPPTPNWQPNSQVDTTDPTLYWQEMGRYIWDVVITESHH